MNLFPHDPLDDLIAAALNGDLSPEERTQFESQLNNNPAARAAYQEAQAMHDLLEKTHKSAQPDSAFEQRMVSGVRRKLQTEKHRETAWESVVSLWTGVKHFLAKARNPIGSHLISVLAVLFIVAILCGVALGPITNGIAPANRRLVAAQQIENQQSEMQGQIDALKVPTAPAAASATPQRAMGFPDSSVTSTVTMGAAQLVTQASLPMPAAAPVDATSPPVVVNMPTMNARIKTIHSFEKANNSFNVNAVKIAEDKEKALENKGGSDGTIPGGSVYMPATVMTDTKKKVASNENKGTAWDDNWKQEQETEKAAASTVDSRKLIRNAQLDLEVKSFQAAIDSITAQTKAAGGYVDTSNSQKGGNGKLQGTVVVKVLPQNLDAFLLKLRDLGQVQNQSVSTDDVTKDYFDTQARLVNSQKMETQLQDLLKRENGKVSDLLQVERELGRVRGEIEQMQGQLKLYDFQVQYATVTIQMREKDLTQAAAYLLKEQDEFSLFATDVEGTFQKARKSADDFKAQVLVANLNHNSGSDVSAELTVMVAPDQIEAFLSEVRGMGRVANFTRQTQRVAKDGGDDQNPADQTLTEKDKVQVHLAIRSDDETRKQVALTVVAKAVDTALDSAKTAALANAGVEILSSSLNKTPQGQSTAQLTVRVPGKNYDALIAAFGGLGRTSSLSIQRNDNSGPGANGDDAPVIVALSLTDDDAPLQQTALNIRASDVDAQSQQIKKSAAANSVEVKASSFQRQPDGSELAQMTFRLPLAKYPAFLESVKALGKVESLTVERNDRPDQTRTDDTAPAEINLQLHNQRDLVTEDTGLWATLRQTFGEGAGALFGSIRVIGVLLAFMLPWFVTLVLLAWVGRRIYVWRKNR